MIVKHKNKKTMKNFTKLLITLLAAFCCTLNAVAAYDGTPVTPTKINGNYADYGLSADYDGYYVISTAEELYGFADWVNKGTTAARSAKSVLTADIVVNENVLTSEGELNGDGSDFVAWTPIGTSSYSYYGIFDGNGHTVSGLYFNNSSTDNVGLFGYFTSQSSVIKNVGVLDSYFNGRNYVGGICGYIGFASIINCYNAGTISGNSYVGGIVGGNVYTCTITSCFNLGKISGSSLVGGINGSNKSATYNSNFVLTGSVSSANGGTFATAEEFASGKVAYLLNSNNWYQNLKTPADLVPVLDPTHAKVWLGCGGIYVNDPTEAPHSMVDGICSVCGYANAPTLIDAQAAENLHISTDYIGYYAIANTGHLYWFADKVNDGATSSKGVLIADIVVNENVLTDDGELNGDGSDFIPWTPIGKSGNTFVGTFDGNGHTISGLYCNTPSTNYVGLFGYAYRGGVINLGVIDSYFSGQQYVGGISGYGGYITNCYNKATVVGSEWYIGGICGDYGTITDCYNMGNVTGSSATGGICGHDCRITNCYNTGAVTSSGGSAGGISGSSGATSIITNCYNTGTITGGSSIGGICGEQRTHGITNCYNLGTITGNLNVGGICGNFSSSEPISGCYNTGIVEGNSNFQSICGVNDGNITNCVYLAGSVADRDAVGLTSAEFASGKATFVLNGSTSSGNLAWYQTIGEDAMPVWNNTHGKVYGTSPCASAFSNDGSNAVKEHDYHSGICSQCGEYEPATLVDGVYQIANAGQLYWFADLVNAGTVTAKAELIADIVVNENVLTDAGELNGTPSLVWTPIGTEANRFKGTFNGNNHTISGLYTDYGYYIGLFGYASNATISNVGVVDSYLSGSGNYATSSYTGGICGYAVNTTINLCYNESFVRGYTNIGGICGYIWNTTISNCYNMGAITSDNFTVVIKAYVGGIYGFVNSQHSSYVSNCYNAGVVRGGHDAANIGSIGGNVGSNTIITNCFYLVGSAATESGRVQKGIGASSLTETTADEPGKTDPFNSIFDVHSGRLTYLLNGSVNAGTTCYQTIGTDDRPTWDDSHGLVYESSPCPFSNNSDGVAEHHYDEFGQCTICGVIKQPALVTEENHVDLALGEEYIGYYAIGDAIELLSFAAMVNEGNTDIKGVLVADIELNENVLNNDGTLNGTPSREWTPIGTEANAFAGIFDGNNHTVSGLYFSNDIAASYPTGGVYIGLIGYASGALITNVGVLDTYFYGNRTIGGICGGAFEHTEINNCYSKGTISGDATIGGICGYAQTSNITHCYNDGIIDVGYSVIGGSACIGGIVGATSSAAIVSDCYNVGSITSRRDQTYVGGIVGDPSYSDTVLSCYNVGTISGLYSVGAICGTKGGTQSNCFYLEGCAIDEEKGVQNGIGSTSDEPIADEWRECTMATLQDFANGVVTYHLNNGKSEGDIVWYQTIGSDDFPVWDSSHKVVYASSPCHTDYSNAEGAEKPHNWENGQCTVCREYQPATLVTEEIYGELSLSEEHIGFYAIGNAGQLYWFAELVNGGTTDANGVLVADVVVNKNVLTAEGKLNGDGSNFKSWIPIGYYEGTTYQGVFDGNGHTVSGLYFSDTYAAQYGHGMHVGLFGMAGGNGTTIKNLGVVDSYFRGYTYIGSICGSFGQGSITNCYNAATLSACDGGSRVGGICGNSYKSVIENCHNTGLVGESENNEEIWYGGICGYAEENSMFRYCYNTGTISASGTTGGICGFVKNSNVSKCYNIGTVTTRGNGRYSSRENFGGISGTINNVTIENCYNAGYINTVATSGIGGISGYATNNSSIINCHNIGTIKNSNKLVGGILGDDYGNTTIINSYYLEGCAMDGLETIQNGVGASPAGEILADVNGKTISATAEEFASGKIGLLLNSEDNNAWYQTLFSDASPVLDSTHNKITGYVEGVDIQTVYGDLLIGADYEIAENKILNIPADATVTTTGDAVITNNGTIVCNGSIAGNNLMGEGNFTYNQYAESDITLNTDSYAYKGSEFTLADGLDVTISREYCGKTFTFDDAYTTVSYENNRNVTTEGKVSWTNSVTSNVIERTFVIEARTLTVSNIVANSKEYDGNTVAEGSFVPVGIVETDEISVSYTANFADKNAGENKAVTFNFAKSGADADNYVFANETDEVTADITPKAIAISNIVASSKEYDGDAVAEGTYSYVGVLENDDVEISYTASFANKTVGTDKPVTFNFEKSGADAENYVFEIESNEPKANITAKTLTLSDFVASDKVYDGTTEATNGAFADNRVAGDELEFTFDYEFETENAGDNISVIFSNIAVSGVDAENYELATLEGTAKATISPITDEVVVTVELANKSIDYDGEQHEYTAGEAWTITSSHPLYNAQQYIAELEMGAETVQGTDAGEYAFGWSSDSFENDNANFTTVRFDVTDGALVINKIDGVQVTIAGVRDTAMYDGVAHTVEGFAFSASNALYKETDMVNNGLAATATQTEVGETKMGLMAANFANVSRNFSNVTFSVEDGGIVVEPKNDVVVTITENSGTVTYNGEGQTVSGYAFASNTELYNETDFTFNGVAEAKGTAAGTYEMNISAEDFENTNANFTDVTFMVVDGTLTIEKSTVTPNMPELAIETHMLKLTYVELPENWAWEDETLGLVEGENEVVANYVGADAGNYTTEKVTIVITRLACQHDGEHVILGAKEATCTVDGYTGDLSCSICGLVYEQGSVIPALGHTHGEPVEENRKEPTCTVAGSVDSVVYCTIDGEEISRETYVLPMLEHVAGKKVAENYVAPTFTAVGSVDSVVYCTIGGEELSRETFELPMLQKTIEKIEILSMPKTEYVVGEDIDITGAKISVTFNDGSVEEIDLTNEMLSGFDNTLVAEQDITVTYLTFTTTIRVTVNEKTAVSDIATDATSIYAYGHTIVVETVSFIGKDIMVYDINGRIVAKVSASNERTEINVPRTGVYGVRIETVSATVMIR